mmetsp:Transcript_20796/g.30964  ORF Transcript_20796/g.30964 Transcript_20796/m.30964 type:complete len:283 (-) Transcript_20796:33-881(-)
MNQKDEILKNQRTQVSRKRAAMSDRKKVIRKLKRQARKRQTKLNSSYFEPADSSDEDILVSFENDQFLLQLTPIPLCSHDAIQLETMAEYLRKTIDERSALYKSLLTSNENSRQTEMLGILENELTIIVERENKQKKLTHELAYLPRQLAVVLDNPHFWYELLCAETWHTLLTSKERQSILFSLVRGRPTDFQKKQVEFLSNQHDALDNLLRGAFLHDRIEMSSSLEQAVKIIENGFLSPEILPARIKLCEIDNRLYNQKCEKQIEEKKYWTDLSTDDDIDL